MQFPVILIHFAGSPNCPAVHTTVNTVLLTISIQKLPVMWLPKWYYVEVSSYYNGSIAEVYNSTLKGSALFDVTPLQPGTVYNISVIPCNMAGCNESCDIHSVQTMARGDIVNVYVLIMQLNQQHNPMCKHCFNCVCNCYCLHVHSEPGGASRTDFDITFIVIGAAAGAAVLVVLATCMVTTAVAIIACTLKRFAITSSILISHELTLNYGKMHLHLHKNIQCNISIHHLYLKYCSMLYLSLYIIIQSLSKGKKDPERYFSLKSIIPCDRLVLVL